MLRLKITVHVADPGLQPVSFTLTVQLLTWSALNTTNSYEVERC